ncbi:MAG TPA: NAD(P)-dependent oxidoreductase [Hyphomicrobiaceae bacterium]|nr:NAD(P)-dependent oxidoreductase [Hyphomicrobiaceae bacterium]
MADTNVIVTGASGFLAAWLLPKLVARGHHVIAMDLKCDPARLNQVTHGAPPAGITWQDLDVTDATACCNAVRTHMPTEIIHLAALMIPACHANPLIGVQVNLVGHMHMLEAAREAGVRLTYTSSMAAKPRGKANAPANLYGVFKRADEEISRLYAQDFGVSSFGLRPNIVYGIGRELGATSVITHAAKAAALGEAYTLPWRTRAGFEYVDDMAEIFARLIDAEWDGAHVSDMSNTTSTIDELLDGLTHAAPGHRITVDDVDRLSITEGFETASLERTIGALPATSLAKGIAATLTHFRELQAKNML